MDSLLSGIDLDVRPDPLPLKTTQAGRVVYDPDAAIRFIDQNQRLGFPFRVADCGSTAITLANAIGMSWFAMFRAASLVAHPSYPGFGMRTSEKGHADARNHYGEKCEGQTISHHEEHLGMPDS